jgi:hypothetical protein
MADEKNQPKPFSSGILSQTSGRPGETIQRTYNNEVVRERPQTIAPKSPPTSDKRG